MGGNSTAFQRASAGALILWAAYPLVTSMLYFINFPENDFYGYGDLVGVAGGILLYKSRWGLIPAWVYVLIRLSSEIWWALYTIETDERVSQSVYLAIETWWNRLYVPLLATVVLALLTISAYRRAEFANKAKQPTPQNGAADS